MNTKRVLLYARVSTSDHNQNPETQLHDLRDYAARRGFTIAEELVDYGSGANDARPAYTAQ